MARSSVCAYGKRIQKCLIDLEQDQIWLVGQVKAATGQYFDGGYLQKILKGTRKPPKIISAINDILEIEYPTDEQDTDQDSA